MDNNKFQIEYDDEASEVVDKVAKILQNFGLSILMEDRDTEIDGYTIYKITKTNPVIDSILKEDNLSFNQTMRKTIKEVRQYIERDVELDVKYGPKDTSAAALKDSYLNLKFKGTKYEVEHLLKAISGAIFK